jgi:hypothetical protein
MFLRRDVKDIARKKEKVPKAVKTNLKFGISKDSP